MTGAHPAISDLKEEIDREPFGVVVDLLCEVERTLSRDQVSEVTARVVRGRALERKVALELVRNPRVLRTGRSPCAIRVGELLLALKKAGAGQLAAPRCRVCDRELSHLRERARDWGCYSCFAAREECAGCGEIREVHARDRHGRPHCGRCRVHDDDPTEALLTLVAALETGLDRGKVLAALETAARQASGRRRIAWAIVDHPELLTGEGALAPVPGVLRFIDALVHAGASTVVMPCCPRCGRQRLLNDRLDGTRVCTPCARKAKAEPCSRCGKTKPVNHREDGQALCEPCWSSDPRNREVCAVCGIRRRVAGRTDAGPHCHKCRHRPERTCAICGRTGRGTISRATGQPVCDLCRGLWAICSGCGSGASVMGGTRQAPLCARCVSPDPAFWKRCPVCRTTWQLTNRTCMRCCLDRRLREMFTAPDGSTAPELDQLREKLVGVDRPDHVTTWLGKANVRTTIRAVVAEHRALTHEALDAMPPGKTLDFLRSMLVTAGALEPRDERLVRLERWVHQAIADCEVPDHRRVLHGYAIWHLLRRLRGRLAGRPANEQQVLALRIHATAAVHFLHWLDTRGLTLDTCKQLTWEQYLATKPSYGQECANFVRWAISRRYAQGLTAPATRWTTPATPLDEDRRWADARRLLHDDTLAVADRVAGLLVVLYAQKISSICQLTTEHVTLDADRVLLRLGTRPIELPSPMDALMRELVATRRSTALLAPTGNWLFPGRHAGQPLSESRLMTRLRAIGLSPRQSRNTALFTLAGEVPPAILAKMLGVHIAVAVQWQHASAGDWMAYAADVAGRTSTGNGPTAARPDGSHAVSKQNSSTTSQR